MLRRFSTRRIIGFFLLDWLNTLGVLVLAIAAVSRYINDDVRAKTMKKMRHWFGEDVLEAEFSQVEPGKKKFASGD